MSVLSGCPFCGKKAKIVTTKEFYEKHHGEHCGKCILIRCHDTDCGCEKWYFSDQDYETAVENAVEGWNRRTFNA